ncbi:hypothetical protein [Lysinibacillus antri]|uniref:Uncharacterized protein n=1 Tax=Lysinibacillus antri TaxID=2498145 RepID=A0A432L839_9BACI|nr:hypothetical protein [Lysinibacillus antri]RUL48685.1 hypothetical protein EK386_16515 [Lysinibacillus antri]
MYAVHYFEKKNLLLNQLLNQVPAQGSQIKIKGRKANILAVNEVAPNKYHVFVELEVVKKQAVVSALDKKKRR